jgi:hypothetical protein
MWIGGLREWLPGRRTSRESGPAENRIGAARRQGVRGEKDGKSREGGDEFLGVRVLGAPKI